MEKKFIETKNNEVPIIPTFYLVSSNPDRENTEDYIRNNFDPSQFYECRSKSSNSSIIMPEKRSNAGSTNLDSVISAVNLNEDMSKD